MRSRPSALAVAFVVIFATLPVTARAEDPSFVSSIAAPKVYGALRWNEKAGFWFTDDRVVAINKRIDYLEKRAAKECVDTQIAIEKKRFSTWWKIGSGLATGIAIGFCAAHTSHCGISK